MGIIGWIVLGLLAGLIARALLPNDPPGGIIATTIVGIVGAVAAGAIAQAAGWGDPVDEFWDVSTWITAIVGAAVLLIVWGALSGRRSRRPLGL
ncbi:MAG: GlsB/YeaQ/YmgE family stress response membrane protein [Thermoleophilia bacterium]|nr:GlsB/YeaQ/YmgE family stress response membrane protein [Thermoleophilia bacterium]